MTLRDYFAGQAISGLLSEGWVMSQRDIEAAASLAYSVADVMVAARDRSAKDLLGGKEPDPMILEDNLAAIQG